MNAKPLPLAAALLLVAAASQAQLLPTGNGGSFNFGNSSNGSFSMAPAATTDDDMIFKCSTVPYRPCTTAEMNKRELILETGKCPAPATPACTAFMMNQSGAGATQLLGNQSNPSTANDEFYKKCGTVPYRLCTPEEEKKRQDWLKSEAKDKETPAIAGPPQLVDMPKGHDGKMLQYPDGRVEYCFDDSCTKTNGRPLNPEEARSYLWNDYAEQKQMANSINGGAPNKQNSPVVPDNPAGGSCTQLSCDVPPTDTSNGDTASTPPGGNKSSGAGGFSAFNTNTGGSNDNSDSSANDDASAVNNARNAANPGSGTGRGAGGGAVVSSSGNGGGTRGGSGVSLGEGGGSRELKIKGATLDGTYSYTALMPAVETTIKAGEAIKAGQTEFANPEGTTVNTGTRAELQIEDTSKLGKQQFNKNR